MARRPPAVARVLERVTATVRSHEMLPPGQVVIVACSGGPDSTCLLHALHRLRRLFRIRLTVFHFDHGLHPASGEHARYVKGLAARLRLPYVLRVAEDEPAGGQSVEAWARLARYAALSTAALETGAGRAALGHTRDDQAETVLLGLVRGGGLDALSGISPVGTLPPLGLRAVRPLLSTTREEVLAFCRALGLRPREDPTNRDRRFLRNRLRLEVLPHLEEVLDRDVKVTLARTADHVRADSEHLELLASVAARRAVVVDDREIRLMAEVVDELAVPVAARVVRHALRLAAAAAGEWEGDVEAAHVEAVLALCSGRPGRRVDLPGSLKAERRKGYVRIARSEGGRRGGSTGRG